MQRVSADVVGLAGEKQLQPILVKRQVAVIVPNRAEGMEVTVAYASPVDELDAELERAPHLPDKLGLVDPEVPIERLQVRDGRLPDPNRADLLGFDQANGALAPERLCQGRRGHPAGGAAADDDDVPQSGVGHTTPGTRAALRTWLPPSCAARADTPRCCRADRTRPP